MQVRCPLLYLKLQRRTSQRREKASVLMVKVTGHHLGLWAAGLGAGRGVGGMSRAQMGFLPACMLIQRALTGAVGSRWVRGEEGGGRSPPRPQPGPTILFPLLHQQRVRGPCSLWLSAGWARWAEKAVCGGPPGTWTCAQCGPLSPAGKMRTAPSLPHILACFQSSYEARQTLRLP